jgi:hypothetical protein
MTRVGKKGKGMNDQANDSLNHNEQQVQDDANNKGIVYRVKSNDFTMRMTFMTVFIVTVRMSGMYMSVLFWHKLQI